MPGLVWVHVGLARRQTERRAHVPCNADTVDTPKIHFCFILFHWCRVSNLPFTPSRHQAQDTMSIAVKRKVWEDDGWALDGHALHPIASAERTALLGQLAVATTREELREIANIHMVNKAMPQASPT